MFNRRSRSNRYSQQQALQWLSFLAVTLSGLNQTVFYLEALDNAWLPPDRGWWLPFTQTVAGLGVVAAASCAVTIASVNWLSLTFIIALAAGLLSVVIVIEDTAPLHLRPVDRIQWPHFAQIRSYLLSAIRSVLKASMLIGLLSAIIWWLAVRGGIDTRLSWTRIVLEMLGPLIGWAYYLVAIWLLRKLVTGLITLVKRETYPTRTSPNEGTRNSATNAFVVFTLSLAVTALIAGIGAHQTRSSAPLGPGFVTGEVIGLLGAFGGGGLFVVRHSIIRLLLRINGLAPWAYVHFLNYAADLLFIRKVGSGYIFSHRLLREYFASLPQTEKDSEPKTRAASAAPASA